MRRATTKVAYPGVCALGVLIVFGLVPSCDRTTCPTGDETGRDFLGDSPLPRLCSTDSLELSPREAHLVSHDGQAFITEGSQGGAGGTAGGAVGAGGEGFGGTPVPSGIDVAIDQLSMSLVAMDEAQHPRESNHVEVRVTEGGTLVRLDPGSGTCKKLADDHLRCRLDVAGSASFSVVHRRNGGGTAIVEAESGLLSTSSRLYVTDVPLGVVGLRFNEHKADAKLDGYRCWSSEFPTCDDVQRAYPLSLSLLDAQGEPEPSSKRQAVEVKMVPGDGHLSHDANCAAPPATDLFEVGIGPGAVESERFYWCPDGKGGGATLSATLGSLRAASHRLTASAAPAVLQSESQLGMGGSSPGSARFVKVKDCEGTELEVELRWQVDGVA